MMASLSSLDSLKISCHWIFYQLQNAWACSNSSSVQPDAVLIICLTLTDRRSHTRADTQTERHSQTHTTTQTNRLTLQLAECVWVSFCVFCECLLHVCVSLCIFLFFITTVNCCGEHLLSRDRRRPLGLALRAAIHTFTSLSRELYAFLFISVYNDDYEDTD